MKDKNKKYLYRVALNGSHEPIADEVSKETKDFYYFDGIGTRRISKYTMRTKYVAYFDDIKDAQNCYNRVRFKLTGTRGPEMFSDKCPFGCNNPLSIIKTTCIDNGTTLYYGYHDCATLKTTIRTGNFTTIEEMLDAWNCRKEKEKCEK